MESSIRKVLERYPNGGRDSLIPILQEVQEDDGYLSEKAVRTIAAHLGIPSCKVFGVATFYNQFRFQPKGKYHIMLCRGTACHVKGSKKLQDHVTDTLGIQPGETTRDKLFSLEVVACMGACGLAPVVNINGEFYAKTTPLKLGRLIDELKQEEVRDVAS